MNPATQALILQIVTTALQINAEGIWHAFVQYSGHVNAIESHLRPSGTNYQRPQQEDRPQWETWLSTWKQLTPEDEQRALTEHLNWLRGFLTNIPEEAAA